MGLETCLDWTPGAMVHDSCTDYMYMLSAEENVPPVLLMADIYTHAGVGPRSLDM